MSVKFISTAPTPAPALTPMEQRAVPTTPSPEKVGPTEDPRTIPPKPTAVVEEHESVGRVWPERGLPESYRMTGVRYDEGDMVGTGGSCEGKKEEMMKWARYGHDPAETTQAPPQAVPKRPFKLQGE